MSKYVGARSHASQVAADHRSRIAAGNASRLAAAGLALFLTFGFGGVAKAASDQASDKAQSVAADGSAGAAGTPTATGSGPAAGAEQAAEKAADQAAEKAAEVVEISAVSSESAVSTLVVERTAHGVTTTETTTTPVAEALAGTEVPSAAQTTTDPATSVALMAKTTNQPNANAAGAGSNTGGASSNAGGASSNAGGAGSNAGGQNGAGNGQGGNGNGSGQPDGGTYVETIVCHKDGVVLVIDDSGLNGHAADRFDHGHLEGVAECADRDNDGVPDTVDADPDDSDNTGVVRNPVDGCQDESMTTAATASADECDGDADGGESDTDCEQSGETCTDGDEIEVDDEPEKVHPTVPGDKVEGPGTKGPGTWNNGGKAGGKKPKPEVLGEEGERPRGGTKSPGKGGKTTTTDVDRTPGGRVPSQPEPTANDRPARDGEVLGEAAERPSKNRPAALVLPQTGAASNLAAQAGAGLILVLGGLLTLGSRRRDSES